MPKRPRLLYHFTCRLWWRFIEHEGISMGEVPVRRGRILNHPNLTTDLEPARQGWALHVGEHRLPGGEKDFMALNKRAVRIAVRIPLSDTRLVRWQDLAKQWGMDGET